MKIAITGATGFVGTRLVERLHSEGEEILVLTRNLEKGKVILFQAIASFQILLFSFLFSKLSSECQLLR